MTGLLPPSITDINDLAKQLRIYKVVCWRNDDGGGGLDDNWIVLAANHRRAAGYVMAHSQVQVSEFSVIHEIGISLGTDKDLESGGVIAGPHKGFGGPTPACRTWIPCEDQTKWTLALDHFVEVDRCDACDQGV